MVRTFASSLTVLRNGLVVMAVIALFALLFLLAHVGQDTFEERHATLEAARKSQLSERGWLPDFLPPSARDIQLSGHIDSNTAWGKFYFRDEDWAAFEKNLFLGIAVTPPYVGWPE